ncbi:baseplate J/gp47 family protein [Rhodoplanes sp. TEM]|uniref:Baseplate J/gp47 family protein n=1 Tax=Rhodoplanes tepidamans TaxID=200616 RepID=A0ABT5J544_RHOTP|nr:MULTISPECIES: baseplate J/gp47 family protein [Rhodoplanes]MDC7784768.1 baseplate J/gp47 family protein [Rhodoplanes tepidamans]MDC7982235.1 baseplate J/gp47 family protein [Rhodoplanes sp. TEM]MDQ0356242.1 phage-related baseplate assembly protein [Rhodoplanes tepidamans]
MARYLQPDLTRLPKPQLIEEITANGIIAEIKAYVLALWDQVRATRPDLPPLDFLGLETEPMTILIEAFAYRETLLRALVNDKARAVLLAFAVKSDLDHIGALMGVVRATLVPATDTSPAIMESDDQFRRRIQMAPEALSVAGPAGAYEFHALSIDPSILDAYAYTPREGEVHVVVVGQGVEPVSDTVLKKLVRRFKLDDIVPLTDTVTVRRAEIVTFDLALRVQVVAGADVSAVRSAIEAAVRGYLATRARIGSAVYLSAIVAAAKTPDIENIVITAPSADVLCAPAQIAKVGSIAIDVIVVG